MERNYHTLPAILFALIHDKSELRLWKQRKSHLAPPGTRPSSPTPSRASPDDQALGGRSFEFKKSAKAARTEVPHCHQEGTGSEVVVVTFPARDTVASRGRRSSDRPLRRNIVVQSNSENHFHIFIARRDMQKHYSVRSRETRRRWERQASR